MSWKKNLLEGVCHLLKEICGREFCHNTTGPQFSKEEVAMAERKRKTVKQINVGLLWFEKEKDVIRVQFHRPHPPKEPLPRLPQITTALHMTEIIFPVEAALDGIVYSNIPCWGYFLCWTLPSQSSTLFFQELPILKLATLGDRWYTNSITDYSVHSVIAEVKTKYWVPVFLMYLVNSSSEFCHNPVENRASVLKHLLAIALLLYI